MSTVFAQSSTEEELLEIASRADLDIRMVKALAGDRTLNAREESILQRMQEERGEGLYSDMLYALTYKAFPARQARHLWDEIIEHRQSLRTKLNRDVGISVATHDYLVNVSKHMIATAVIEESKMADLANVATQDGLTNLYDHTTFKHKLKEEMERQTRYGGALSVVLFDIDHFKKVNDCYGHAEGDTVLRKLSDVVRGQIRSMDTAARYGGEEFAIILPEVDREAAFIFAERLRQTVEASFAEHEPSITISLGTTSLKQGEQDTVETVIKKADEQLYKAKNAGRNRVCAEHL